MMAIAVSVVLYGVALESTVKKRVCVEYKILNSRHTNILAVTHGTTESECFMPCVRYPDCMAYNMLHHNNTCELLHRAGHCDETGEHQGSTFAHLGECQGPAPWAVGRSNWTEYPPCLSWLPFEAIIGQSRCPAGILCSPGGWACATLTPNKGLYLPGFYAATSEFRVITEEFKPVWCFGFSG